MLIPATVFIAGVVRLLLIPRYHCCHPDNSAQGSPLLWHCDNAACSTTDVTLADMILLYLFSCQVKTYIL
jgi:hypothetical protein